ncbi:MAG: nucleotide sugar dehydrogenase [Gaiellaceae bacterium]
MSKVAVFGAGYVGLVTGACFADLGHEVVIADILPERIAALRAGEVPIYEPGLDVLLERNLERLSYTLDVAEAVEGAEFLYVAVGTPPTYSGDADLSAVWTVVDSLEGVAGRAVVVMKSTVPVGTGEKVRHRLDARGLEHVGYVSNPEFTAEGTAVRDFQHPDRIVIGAFDDADGDAVAELHTGIEAPIVRADVASAEMIKLAANAALMTRISFINEIANVCEATGADVVRVAEGVGLDRRIGSSFLRAGIGYGGSCLVGEETVVVRSRTGARMTTLEQLYEETETADEFEILTWRPDGDGPEFLPVEFLTRREYEGEIVEVRTKMGRRVRCTPDHPFVVQDGSRKLAEELTHADWLPIAQGTPSVAARPRARRLNVIGAFSRNGLSASDVIVRPQRDELAGIGAREIQAALAPLGHPRGAVARSHDILRSSALRLDEAAELDLELEECCFGTARNGTYVPTTVDADESFWRIIGLYLAEGHCAIESSGRHRLQWSFHPSAEDELVDEVAGFWRDRGVKASIQLRLTSKCVTISSRVLAAWWLGVLGLGRNCYDHRLPDLIWDEPEARKRALLAGLWLGEGSSSFVNRGSSVVLEYGTVSRELADGVLRLLGELGIVARLKVGRTAKSTVDTNWLVVSGADQVEQLLDLVKEHHRRPVRESLARTKRIAPKGYRRMNNAAWARVVDVKRQWYTGHVYSLEVSPTHTFVTTGGLVTSNCFPKDSLALKQLAANSGYHFQLLNAVIEVNELQKRRVIGKLQHHLGSLRGTTIALLGLAFKPHTDDVREAPSLVLAGRLVAEGAEVRAWDPVADGKAVLPHATICESPLEAMQGADAAVLVTEWPELADLDWSQAAQTMRRPLLVDGRNMLDPALLRAAGFTVDGIGRAAG